ncbi:hypothetical protein CIT292_10981 [Citrobacter youngae ATCC 29220]|uniref:Uncharacterized protein n=1 Tax=Citrobacter youngae ATCC 29220 TaxID=500640 RepID=D4BJY7_9ENTR|nr:hypothetical protein CIT292_10981 [Citrobacter youngae ATCC 29220]
MPPNVTDATAAFWHNRLDTTMKENVSMCFDFNIVSESIL